ncbi:hypothetical protein [uncultured Microscilla sp.]|uniref:hypothetical protein n=1 Tax=uncultured Microscilla sp. TaxID=432653 RepID=UPI0026294A79|nr:hypothetical protein [uncultured Microscilla sp.]
MNPLTKITLERFARDLTSGQPVYKLAVDLDKAQVVWRGRENVKTLGQVVAPLSEEKGQAVDKLSQAVLTQRPANLYENPQPLAGYERIGLEFANGTHWQTVNHFGQYYASMSALKQGRALPQAPPQDQDILHTLQAFSFGLDDLLGVHPLVGKAGKHENTDHDESPNPTNNALSLTEQVLPQLPDRLASELLAKLQKRHQQLQSVRNLEKLWASLQGVLRLQNELMLNYAQPQQREEYVCWFDNMHKAFAQSSSPYEQIIAEDIHEARQFFPKTQPLNTQQICRILEYVLGKNHPEMVHSFIEVLEKNSYRLAQ